MGKAFVVPMTAVIDSCARLTTIAPAGVGKPAYDWFLTNVRLMPYDSDEIVTLAQRELERHWANYTTERHRNRNLPELELPRSAEEYEAQLAGTDAKIRKWLKDEEIITIPDYIPGTYQEVGFNAPWIVRPNGPMFRKPGTGGTQFMFPATGSTA